MSGDLYGERLKELARAVRPVPPESQATARRHSPLCGDRVDVGLILHGDHVAEMGGQVRGCLLCQASAALLHRHGPGLDRAGLENALTALTEFLAGAAGDPLWPDWQVFAPVREHRSRHACVTLPLETALDALNKAHPLCPVTAVILAAGSSTRMGARHKLELPWNGKTVLRQVAETVSAATGIDRTLVVLNGGRQDFAHALRGLPLRSLALADDGEGMAASVRAAMQVLPPDSGAVMLCLADMPLVDPCDIQAVVAAWKRLGQPPIVRPRWAGKPGHPVLFHRDLFPQLAALRGDQGGRSIIAAHAADVHFVEAVSDGVLMDVDTPADYLAALSRLTRGVKG